jgi:hypothetical protein|tara:strand:+ start:368 stop:607 length:240 start_codon:yes stop_codon:yes gene_type:complete
MFARNEFYNNLYKAIGSEVSGTYMGTPFLGNITSTRMKYGNEVQVSVEDTITDETYLIDGDTLLEGGNGLYTNLHVYFS